MLSLPSCPSPLGALRPLPSDSRTVILSGVVRLSGFAESEDSGRAALRYSLTSEPRPWPHHHDRALPASPWHLLRSLHTLAVRLTWICPNRGAPVGPSEPAQAPSSWSDSAGQTQPPSTNPSRKGSPALTHTCSGHVSPPGWVLPARGLAFLSPGLLCSPDHRVQGAGHAWKGCSAGQPPPEYPSQPGSCWQTSTPPNYASNNGHVRE